LQLSTFRVAVAHPPPVRLFHPSVDFNAPIRRRFGGHLMDPCTNGAAYENFPGYIHRFSIVTRAIELGELDDATRKGRMNSGLKAWGEWMNVHKASVVVPGGPLGKTKRTSPQGVTDTTNNMAGYVVVQAESHEEAARMFEKHPHFTIFPGDSVEIMECLPIPGQ
jgi:hypothetical protein